MSRADLPLPLALDEVTPDWVAAALCTRDPAARVRDVEIVEVIPGSATKVRLHVRHDLDEVPAALCLKTGFDEALRQLAGEAYANEVRFFRELARSVPRAPECFYAESDPSNGQSVLLLEDLVAAGATFGRVTKPLTPDQAGAVLDLQAEWHARFWERDDLLDLSERFNGHAGLEAVIEHLTAESHWNHHLGLPKGAPVRGTLRDRDAVKASLRRLWEIGRHGPRTLCHGDTHVGNLWFSADGRPGYLDWQTAMVGPWAHDVTAFLGGAMTVADRRAHEGDLLRRYLGRLSENGVERPPTFEDAWLAYRRHLLHGLLWVLTPEEMQPNDVTAENALRFATAANDLDTLGALE